MKLSEKIKKATSSIVILGILIMPFSNILPIKKAKAQSILGNINMTGNGINASGLGALMTQLPGCKATIKNGIKTLFARSTESISDTSNITSNVLSSEKGSEQGTLSLPNMTLKKTAEAAAKKAGATIVADPAMAALTGINTYHLKNLDKSMDSINKNQTCLDSIGKALIKLLIQKFTASIVNWIQTGRGGEPLYLTNPSKFFRDIAKEQVLTFNLELNDSTKYPFAKNFMQGIANNFNNTFQQNAEYSLNKMIAQTNPSCKDKNGNITNCSLAFNEDFSQGGWGAWEALTQVPANNPLGFQLMASNELATRLEGTSESPAQVIKDQLQQANGFLDEQRCTDPWGLSKEKSDAALKAGVKKADGTIWGVCKKWENVTPGMVVGHALTKSMDNSDNALLSANTLNDAIAALIDAATAKISNETTNIINKGLANASSNPSDFSGDASQIAINNPQTQNDFTSSQIDSSTWLAQNPYFNIRTDLNQALIDTQKTYIDKLNLLNVAFIHPDSNIIVNGKTGYNGLLPTIYQLDYCIPGPHPGWKEDSSYVLNKSLTVVKPENEIINMSANGVLNAIKIASGTIGLIAGAAVTSLVTGISFTTVLGVGAAVGTAVPIPVVGTLIGVTVATITAIAINWVTSHPSAKKKERTYYGGLAAALTGLRIDTDKKIDSSGDTEKNGPETQTIMTKASFVEEMNNIFEGYAKTIDKVFTLDVLPTVTQEAYTEYYNAKNYQYMMKDNNQKITDQTTIVKKLEALKIEIDKLNDQLANHTIEDANGNIVSIDNEQSQYEINLKPYISSFARISMNLVSGDDIAEVESMIQQALDEQNYVYNDLLKGPNGCEKDLELNRQGLPWQIYGTKRMPYPLPILYDYNSIPKNGHIPDIAGYPVYNNKTNSMASPSESWGPGFLSYIPFIPDNMSIVNGTYHYCPSNNCKSIFEYELITNFPLHSYDVRLGIADTADRSGTFENTIGIY